LATQGSVISLKEHNMKSIISFFCEGKGPYRKFAITSTFHGPPKAISRSAWSSGEHYISRIPGAHLGERPCLSCAGSRQKI